MPEIDYSQILKRSWQLTKKSKWLWLYGALLALFGTGSGLGGNFQFSLPSQTSPKKYHQILPNQTSQVLGETTSLVSQWLSQINPTVWLFLLVSVMTVFLLSLAISLVLKSWAKGALIAGLKAADDGQSVNLANTSPQGIKAIKNLIILNLLSFVLFVGFILACVVIGSAGYLLFHFSPPLKTLWLILAGTTSFLGLLLALLLLSFTAVYAERLIVLHHHSAWQAWKRGFRFSRRHLIPTLIQALLNGVIGCSIGCLSTLALLVLFILPFTVFFVSLAKNQSSSLLASLAALVFFIPLILSFNLLVRAVLTVFTFSNWNLFCQQVFQEELYET